MQSESGGSDESAFASNGSAVTETEEPDREFVSIGCNELVKKFGPSSDLSDLQKEEAWKQYDSKAVRYDVEIVEVSSETFGGYQVQAKCTGSDSFVQDMAFTYPDSAKSFVMGLNKGSTAELTGTLDTYSGMTGPLLDGFVE